MHTLACYVVCMYVCKKYTLLADDTNRQMSIRCAINACGMLTKTQNYKLKRNKNSREHGERKQKQKRNCKQCSCYTRLNLIRFVQMLQSTVDDDDDNSDKWNNERILFRSVWLLFRCKNACSRWDREWYSVRLHVCVCVCERASLHCTTNYTRSNNILL